MTAEIIFHHGHVYTMNPTQPTASAVAVAGDRILAVGTLSDLEGVCTRQTRLVDLENGTLLPGFTDSHIHLAVWALSKQQINLRPAPSLAAALRMVQRTAAEHPEWSHLQGGGWEASQWPDLTTPLNREMLDSVEPNRPVVLADHALHTLWVNSAALRAAGIDQNTPDPPGGRIERDQHGRATGILREKALSLVQKALPLASVEEIAAAMAAAQADLWSNGIVAVHEMGDFAEGHNFQAYQQLRRQGRLGVRILYYFSADKVDTLLRNGIESGFGDDWLRVGGVKFFADGALGATTAWMRKPYTNAPDNFGIATLDGADFSNTLRRLAIGKLSAAVHAIGDAAVHFVLDHFARLQQEISLPQEPLIPQLRIEHAQLLGEGDAIRFARLRIAASMQPSHAISDMSIAEERWGQRIQHSYAWNDLQRHGVRLAFGSDAPVEPPDVWSGIAAAVTRQRPDGTPGPQGWVPEQRLCLADALYAYTVAPTRLARDPGRGMLAPGQIADMILLKRDPYDFFPMTPLKLAEIRPVATWIGGNLVHTTGSIAL